MIISITAYCEFILKIIAGFHILSLGSDGQFSFVFSYSHAVRVCEDDSRKSQSLGLNVAH